MMFWLPPIASAILFLLCWRGGLIARPRVVGSWCVAGIALQGVAGRFSPAWLVGLLISVGVALYLSLRLKVR
jgi:hypothetical protein